MDGSPSIRHAHLFPAFQLFVKGLLCHKKLPTSTGVEASVGVHNLGTHVHNPPILHGRFLLFGGSRLCTCNCIKEQTLIRWYKIP